MIRRILKFLGKLEFSICRPTSLCLHLSIKGYLSIVITYIIVLSDETCCWTHLERSPVCLFVSLGWPYYKVRFPFLNSHKRVLTWSLSLWTHTPPKKKRLKLCQLCHSQCKYTINFKSIHCDFVQKIAHLALWLWAMSFPFSYGHWYISLTLFLWLLKFKKMKHHMYILYNLKSYGICHTLLVKYMWIFRKWDVSTIILATSCFLSALYILFCMMAVE